MIHAINICSFRISTWRSTIIAACRLYKIPAGSIEFQVNKTHKHIFTDRIVNNTLLVITIFQNILLNSVQLFLWFEPTVSLLQNKKDFLCAHARKKMI